MSLNQVTILAELIASDQDNFGYVTYVFQRLEDVNIESKYIMCTRYPNWEHRPVNLGEIGLLTFKENVAGCTTWFNGFENIPHKYDGIQFIKFIDLPKKPDNEFIM